MVCPVCREVVHLLSGYLARHGVRVHGVLKLCAGSGTAYCSSLDCCSGS